MIRSPHLGKSWEGFVIESIISSLPTELLSYYFFRTVSGLEIDLLIEVKAHTFMAIEIKAGRLVKLKKGFHDACKELNIHHKYVVYGGDMAYKLDDDIRVIPVEKFLNDLPELIQACTKWSS